MIALQADPRTLQHVASTQCAAEEVTLVSRVLFHALLVRCQQMLHPAAAETEVSDGDRDARSMSEKIRESVSETDIDDEDGMVRLQMLMLIRSRI